MPSAKADAFSLAANSFAALLFYNPHMRHDKIEIYIHLIWTTWDRERWITPEIEFDLFPIINEMGVRHGAKTLALNGTWDHVHWLVKYSSTTRTCDLVKDAKGTSSKWANHQLPAFKWRPTYAAFSVSRWNVRSLCRYIGAQKEHHALHTTQPELESHDEDEIPDSE